mmetsp:Transcript_22646/g.57717  ORF Transcript_22646/g.57717 Transcript_22646/m.57717 type:complete len:314 (-) Transcript_22646:175-1116(-)|eukprot:CAMPEP_0113891300 /NCGR_PEP_ID=MMETSP0780_2-20120614/14677_1 /TAXON_ID=652834 /ORGANISM="Palpitomonas bilix" /LENGTH=313 /DNA_ID=CAMNT_0000880897 /DNA_START=246 /DNA_END=1187 /DNA_ORIENTATION=- /assembly_acc=CAM_ASM_000599
MNGSDDVEMGDEYEREQIEKIDRETCCQIVGRKKGIISTMIAFLGGTGFFFGGVCPQVHFAFCIPGLILFGVSFSLMILTTASDPGKLKKNSALELITKNSGDSQLNRFLRKPLVVIAKRGDEEIKLRYCTKCDCYRPPRAAHCYEIGYCVEEFDHFCPWMGHCIAKGNYKYFVYFLVFGSIYALYICGVSLYQWITLAYPEGEAELNFVNWLGVAFGASWYTFLAICLSGCGGAPMAFMGFYHFNLVCNEETTREQLMRERRKQLLNRGENSDEGATLVVKASKLSKFKAALCCNDEQQLPLEYVSEIDVNY